MKYRVKVEFVVDTADYFMGNGRGVQKEDVEDLVKETIHNSIDFPKYVIISVDPAQNMKKKSGYQWCDIFGIKLIDCDGWPDMLTVNNPISLEDFYNKINVSTIQITSNTRYKVFKDIFN